MGRLLYVKQRVKIKGVDGISNADELGEKDGGIQRRENEGKIIQETRVIRRKRSNR